MENNLNPLIIGSGIIFPFKLNQLGRIETTNDITLVRASIINILVFPYGERYFLREFGSKLFSLTDEPNDDVLAAMIRQYVIDVIGVWEKRVILRSVEVGRETFQKINIKLDYVITSTKQPDSFIYPLYLNNTY